MSKKKTRIIGIVLAVVVFFAVFVGMARTIAFILEDKVLSQQLARITLVFLFSNSVISSLVFWILFKMRFEKKR
jgi:hypothetical protein